MIDRAKIPRSSRRTFAKIPITLASLEIHTRAFIFHLRRRYISFPTFIHPITNSRKRFHINSEDSFSEIRFYRFKVNSIPSFGSWTYSEVTGVSYSRWRNIWRERRRERESSSGPRNLFHWLQGLHRFGVSEIATVSVGNRK